MYIIIVSTFHMIRAYGPMSRQQMLDFVFATAEQMHAFTVQVL